MRLDHYSVEELKRQILDIVNSYPELKQARLFFFGSRVVDTGNDRSDIDIGIELDIPIPLLKLAALKEELEKLPLLYSFDLVDFARVSDEFKQLAKEKVEWINQN